MKSWAKTFCVTIAAVFVAAVFRWLLVPVLNDGAPFSTFMIAVIFATWYGGLRSAVLATVLGFFVAMFFFIRPHFSVLDASLPSLARSAIYFIVCFAIAAFGEAMKIAQRRSHHAEHLARQQAETLRITFASIGDAVITTDVNGNVTYLNAVAQALTGWTFDNARGKSLTTVFNVISEQTGQPVRNTDSEISVPGKSHKPARNTILVGRDGSESIIEDSVSMIRDDLGHVAGKIVIFRDISARRQIDADREQTQQLLRASEACLAQELVDMTQLQKLIVRLLVCPSLESALDEVLDAAIILLKADMGHIQLFNSKIDGLEIVAQRGFHKDLLDYFQTVTRDDNTVSGRALRDGRRVMIEDVRAEPTYLPHQKIAASAGYRGIQSTPLLGPNGLPLGMLSTHYRQPYLPTERELRFLDLYARQAADFIERTRNERALRDSEARYRAIGEAIDFGVWMNDAEGRNIYASDCFLRLIGMTQEQCAVFGWRDALHPDDLEPTIAAWKDCVRTKGTWDRELRFKGVDGKWHEILARGVPVKNDSGPTLGWVGINLDISRLKQAEGTLRETDRRKDDFLATLAHELRNPLAPMRNAIQLFRMKGAEDSALESARDVIDRQIQQMTRLIDDLLDVSRVSRNKLELRKERVTLRQVVASAVESSQPLIEEFGHELVVELPDESLVLDADPTRLEQVLLNLLNNAAKYTEKGGRIELKARREGGNIAISVKDNGIGIPRDKLPMLFQMFSQVEDSISRSQGGLGIGLSLVKRLVEMHGGEIEADSEGLGTGSTFLVRLPSNVEAVETPAVSTVASSSPTSKLSILVVDDNQDAANTLTLLLKMMGNETRTVYDGEAAVQEADEFHPDVVLLDIGLPKMNGYDAARHIRNQSWSTKVVLIAVTGWGQEDDKRQAREAGFDEHFVKPVNPRMLMSILAGIEEAKNKNRLIPQEQAR